MLKNLKINFSERIIGLDFLRAFAILSVLYNHGVIYSQKFVSRDIYDYFHFDGVTLFFVLSGFLIGNILFKVINKKGLNFSTLKDFWIRRWFRTLPLYYLILILIFLVEGKSALQNNYQYIVFLQNFYSFKTTFFLESWSLAVEEWFYIIVPFIFWIILKLINNSVQKITPFIISLFVIFCFLFRAYKFNLYTEDLEIGFSLKDRFPFTVLGRLDSIMYGILAAFIFTYFKEKWDIHKNNLFYFAIVIIVIDYILYNHNVYFESEFLGLKFYRHVLHYTVLPFFISLTLPYFYNIKNNNYLGKCAVFISVISYSLYLTHLEVVGKLKIPELVVSRLKLSFINTGFFQYVLFWIFSILISTVLYFYFEKPTTNLRNRLSTKE